jgi:UDP-N-acetylglucosamine acyltransferase
MAGESKVRNIQRIHNSAVVSQKAKIGYNVIIGPYAVIGDNVELGDNCMVGPNVTIEGWTTIGRGNRFFTGATIGCDPQYLKYKGEKTYLYIGDNNIFRENVTVSLGTSDGSGETRIGDNNLFMLSSHVAHDCHVGNFNVLANGSALGGHVTLEDNIVIGSMSGIHQFCKIGKMVAITDMTKIVKDVPPFLIVDGNPAVITGVNEAELCKNGVSKDICNEIKTAYRILYHSKLSINKAVQEMERKLQGSSEIDHFIRFVLNAGRGILR